MRISVGNLKISVHQIIGISKAEFIDEYENYYIGDINEAWEKVEPYTKAYSVTRVKQ